jgi:hypothetical protein
LRNCQIFSHSDQNLHIVRRKWQVPSPLCEGQDATSDSHLRWTACRTDHTCRAGIRCVHARALIRLLSCNKNTTEDLTN